MVSKLDDIQVFSEEMRNFIKKIDSIHTDDLYRIVIEYKDNTFATLKIEDKNKNEEDQGE